MLRLYTGARQKLKVILYCPRVLLPTQYWARFGGTLSNAVPTSPIQSNWSEFQAYQATSGQNERRRPSRDKLRTLSILQFRPSTPKHIDVIGI